MPPKETKDQKEKRLKAVRKKLSQRSRERYYNTRLLENMKASGRGVGSESFKLSKQVISENVDSFNAKYTAENSAFQKRLAYLRESLTEDQYKASPEYRMDQLLKGPVEKGISEYAKYASITEMYDTRFSSSAQKNVRVFSYFGKRKDEVDHLKEAMTSFDDIEKNVNDLMKDDETAKSEAFQEFYADVRDLIGQSKGIVNGTLVVPKENSNNILHVKLTETRQELDPATQEMVTKEVIREPGLHPVTKRDQNNPAQVQNEAIKYVPVDEPLFPHEPCPEDIQQGRIGDCYFIATLSAIAENNPDYIRNCMKDNGDGTVTVRLFDEENTEIYTTVNKTMPVVVRDGKEVPVYGRGALWVAMLEKAYVQSGVVYNASYGFSKNETVASNSGIDRDNYEEIIGGRTEIATINVVGNDIKEFSKDEMAITVPKLPRSMKGDYHLKEKMLFDAIKEAQEKGKVITAGINKESADDNDNMYVKYKGLPPGHAYTIIGTEESNGKKYIKVRNPHMMGGRAYNDKGKAVFDPIPELPGESKIELRDFARTFNDCFAATYNESYFEAKEAKLAGDDKEMYGDAVLKACNEVIGTDHAFVWTNSDSFIDLKKAAIALKAEFKKENASHNNMDAKLKAFFEAAKNYKNDRDARTQTLSKDSRNRSMQRYLLADAIGQFENIYNSNQERGAELQYVDFDQCKESVLDIENRKDLSQAKKAAVDGFVKNDATDASAVEKIDAVEKEGLSRIENGLKNYNTNELMQGLCEVIASRSAKLHKDDLDPRNIERALSPESISRVRTHFGKKLETALKDITKDEFMNIMRSEDIGGKMAEKVQVNLNKNGKEAPVKEQNTVKNENKVKGQVMMDGH